MKIGIITAFGKESRPLRLRLNEIERKEIDGQVCFFLRLGNEEVIVIKSGSGKERGVAAADRLINRFHSQLIINCGVAGAISPHCQIGDVVLSERVIEYDVNAADSPQGVAYQAYPELVKTARQVSLGMLPEERIITGLVLSGNPVVDSQEKKVVLWNRWRGHCAEQEGAGVAKVCQAYHLPWIVIRGISDYADEHALKEFKKNVDHAAQNAALVTFELMKTLLNRSTITH